MQKKKLNIALLAIMFLSTFAPWIRSLPRYTFVGEGATPFTFYQIMNMCLGWRPENRISKILPETSVMQWGLGYAVLPALAVLLLVVALWANHETLSKWAGRYYFFALTAGAAPSYVFQLLVEDGKDDFVSIVTGIGYGGFMICALIGLYAVYFHGRLHDWKFMKLDGDQRLDYVHNLSLSGQSDNVPLEMIEQNYAHHKYFAFSGMILFYITLSFTAVFRGQQGELVAAIQGVTPFLLVFFYRPVYHQYMGNLLTKLANLGREIYNELAVPYMIRGHESTLLKTASVFYLVNIAYFRPVLAHGTIATITFAAIFVMALSIGLIALRGDLKTLYRGLLTILLAQTILVFTNELIYGDAISSGGVVLILLFTLAYYVRLYASPVNYMLQAAVKENRVIEMYRV